MCSVALAKLYVVMPVVEWGDLHSARLYRHSARHQRSDERHRRSTTVLSLLFCVIHHHLHTCQRTPRYRRWLKARW